MPGAARQWSLIRHGGISGHMRGAYGASQSTKARLPRGQRQLDLFASGATRPEILEAYPHLTHEDIEEALRYAADALA